MYVTLEELGYRIMLISRSVIIFLATYLSLWKPLSNETNTFILTYIFTKRFLKMRGRMSEGIAEILSNTEMRYGFKIYTIKTEF